jgi:hypothetical protein
VLAFKVTIQIKTTFAPSIIGLGFGVLLFGLKSCFENNRALSINYKQLIL